MTSESSVGSGRKRNLIRLMEITGAAVYCGSQYVNESNPMTSRSYQFRAPDAYVFVSRDLDSVSSMSKAVAKLMAGFRPSTSTEAAKKYWKQFGDDEAAILALLTLKPTTLEPDVLRDTERLVKDIYAAHRIRCWFRLAYATTIESQICLIPDFTT